MDKVTKIVCLLVLFSLTFLVEIKNVKAENSNSKLEYLDQLVEKKISFVADSFDISTTYIALGMATLLMKDTCEEKQIQGYELLDQIAALTEDKIKSQMSTADDKDVKMILQLLEHHKYFIDVPTPDSEKLIHYIKEGKFAYILQRGYDRGIYKYVALVFFMSVSIWFLYKKNQK